MADPQLHDLGFGDFDGDGSSELTFWNQGTANRGRNDVFVATIPADPTSVPWPVTLVHDATTRGEGMTIVDVDVDGRDDIVLTGGWVTMRPSGWVFEAFDPTFTNGRVAAGQFIPGGRVEIVTSSGDGAGGGDGLNLLRWSGSKWISSSLLSIDLPGPWRNGHSLDVGDVDLDGRLDIFAAEMSLGAAGDARSVVLLGDGSGRFDIETVSDGIDNHESRLVDVDADGDLDIVSKPFNDGSPGIAIFRNLLRPRPLDRWARRVVGERTAQALAVLHGDVDGDGDLDLVTGGHWYENPGSVRAAWPAHEIGAPLSDTVVLGDLDEDGDVDLFGTQGQGSVGDGHSFAWAENDGTGAFTVRTNVQAASAAGWFLQGAALARTSVGGPLEVWLSWHQAAAGLSRLTIPSNPRSGTWLLDAPSPVSQGEQIVLVDVDRDGDLDLLEGHLWLRNSGNGVWTRFDIQAPNFCCANGAPPSGLTAPDRVVAADINHDGRVDAVVSHEYDSTNSLVWFEQPQNPESLWTRHVMTTGGALGIFSLDVADLDEDGDLDVVLGEHDATSADNGTSWVLENADGRGGQWIRHVITHDEEYHNGVRLADLDGDGDLDVYSIGWNHYQVVIHENLGPDAAMGSPWLHGTHRLRLNVKVPPGLGPVGTQQVAVRVELSAAMAAFGRRGRLDPGSLRVVEVDDSGVLLARDLAWQFELAADFDPQMFAAGTVRVGLARSIGVARNLQIYFETTDAAIPNGAVTIPKGTAVVAAVHSASTRGGIEATVGSWDGGARPVGTDAFVELDGAVAIEAEHHSAAAAGATEHAWNPVASSGASGVGAMAALPDSGLSALTMPSGTAVLRYRVTFTEVGTYEVWLRLRAPNNDANVVHVGLDGQSMASADRIKAPEGAVWGWTRRTLDGTNAKIVVPSAGEHTIDIWMGKDGVILDKLYLARSKTPPSGLGPAESPRDGSSANLPPIARLKSSVTLSGPASPRFDGSSSTDTGGDLVNFAWTFGDSAVGSGRTADHTYTRNGSYVVTLTVTDTRGATHVAALRFTVAAKAALASLEIVDSTVVEGPIGTTVTVQCHIRFSAATAAAGSIVVATASGTAIGGIDFVARPATKMTFAAGATGLTVGVVVRGDRLKEADETFGLVVSNAVGVRVADGKATITILNDD